MIGIDDDSTIIIKKHVITETTEDLKKEDEALKRKLEVLEEIIYPRTTRPYVETKDTRQDPPTGSFQERSPPPTLYVLNGDHW